MTGITGQSIYLTSEKIKDYFRIPSQKRVEVAAHRYNPMLQWQHAKYKHSSVWEYTALVQWIRRTPYLLDECCIFTLTPLAKECISYLPCFLGIKVPGRQSCQPTCVSSHSTTISCYWCQCWHGGRWRHLVNAWQITLLTSYYHTLPSPPPPPPLTDP